jgi:predicted nucleic acid-binding protein
LCADLFELVLLEHDLVLGRSVLRELRKALRTKVNLPEARAAEIESFVSEEAIRIVTRAKAADVPVEAADAVVLGEALAGEAEVFVTGDAALLELGSVENLPLVSPRRFWDLLRSQDG